ncbi:MAG: lycopene cyclase [Alphaproteobacteria bacterium]|nr:lycopene cyclase [Alphaproteobacteria bacterium SS10]
MPAVDTHAVILGGGLSGLALGNALWARNIRAIIVEPREQYAADRTWSFWHQGRPPFDDAIQGQWQCWSVGVGERQIIRHGDRYRYTTLDSARVYQNLTTPLLDLPGVVDLKLGHTAHGMPSFDPGSQTWVTETSDGQIRSQVVFDSRPGRSNALPYGQHFLGCEVRTDRRCFDHVTVQLMQFRKTAEPGAIDFLYLLPFAPDHALIEVTRFSASQPDQAEMERWLIDELALITDGSMVTEYRREQGFIPMVAGYRTDGARDPGYCKIGLSGGGARASTGYAFLRILDQAQQLATQVAAGQQAPRAKLDGFFTSWMDRVFLGVLEAMPDRAPAMFNELFEHVPQDRLERFLSGPQRMTDRYAVMRALPMQPFLQQALGLRLQS